MICQTFVKIDLTSENTLIAEMDIGGKTHKKLSSKRKNGLFVAKVFFGD